MRDPNPNSSVCKKPVYPSKIEWDLTSGPLSKLLGLLDTQVQGSVPWVLLEISWSLTLQPFAVIFIPVVRRIPGWSGSQHLAGLCLTSPSQDTLLGADFFRGTIAVAFQKFFLEEAISIYFWGFSEPPFALAVLSHVYWWWLKRCTSW